MWSKRIAHLCHASLSTTPVPFLQQLPTKEPSFESSPFLPHASSINSAAAPCPLAYIACLLILLRPFCVCPPQQTRCTSSSWECLHSLATETNRRCFLLQQTNVGEASVQAVATLNLISRGLRVIPPIQSPRKQETTMDHCWV